MNKLNVGSNWPYHVIFIVMLVVSGQRVWADDRDLMVIEKAQGIVDLHLCEDNRLGVELSCNRNWKQEVDKDAVLMVINEDPAVLLTVARTKVPVTGIEELTEERIKHMGQYAKGFKMEHLQVNGEPAIKVEGFSEAFPEMRLMDFYVAHDYRLYSFLFSVNPKEEWPKYAVLFAKIVESIKITGEKI